MRKDVSGWMTRLDDEMIARFRVMGAWSDTTLARHAAARAAEARERVAVIEAGRTTTFGQLLDEAQRLAAAMRAAGVNAGDVISYQLPNWTEAMVVNLAACWGGFVCNPIVPIYRDREVGFILRESNSKLLFIPETFRSFEYLSMVDRLRPSLPALRQVVVVRGSGRWEPSYDAFLAGGQAGAGGWPEVDPNSVKLLLYTSGTTADPKGVLHTHNTIMAELGAVIRYWKLTRDDVVFMPSPVTHITGYLYALELPFVAGMPVVLMDRWDARTAVQLIREHGAAFTVAATPFLAELVAELDRSKLAVPSLRLFASGGAPVPPEIIRRASRAMPGCAVFRVYGSSEAPTVSLGRHEDGDLCATTDGRIVNHEVEIRDPGTGRIAAAGQPGEIVTRGPEVMVGYTNGKYTEEAFDERGFFHSGDLGYVSHGEYITVTGRKKDLIIRGGEKISPQEVEDVLITHRAIRAVSVVGMPHDRLGETPCAFVIVNEGQEFGMADMTRLLEEAGMARQKFPERLVVLPEFPQTPSGKVKKHVLREQARVLAAKK